MNHLAVCQLINPKVAASSTDRVQAEGEFVEAAAALCDPHGRRRRRTLHQRAHCRPRRAAALRRR